MDYAGSALFGNYNPRSFGWRIEPDLVPFTFQGVNFGRCARDVLPVFVAVLTELVPHIPGGINFGPHDDWAYSATDELPDGSPSFHHYGIAFDLNWRENPMGDYRNNPDAGQKGAIPYGWANDIARKYGCEYGGSWSGGPNRLGFKDYMHFECHLPPMTARSVRVIRPPAPPSPDILKEIAMLPGAPAGLTYQKLLEDIAATTWTADVVPAPLLAATGKVDPKNPTWSATSWLRSIYALLKAQGKPAGLLARWKGSA